MEKRGHEGERRHKSIALQLLKRERKGSQTRLRRHAAQLLQRGGHDAGRSIAISRKGHYGGG